MPWHDITCVDHTSNNRVLDRAIEALITRVERAESDATLFVDCLQLYIGESTLDISKEDVVQVHVIHSLNINTDLETSKED